MQMKVRLTAHDPRFKSTGMFKKELDLPDEMDMAEVKMMVGHTVFEAFELGACRVEVELVTDIPNYGQEGNA